MLLTCEDDLDQHLLGQIKALGEASENGHVEIVALLLEMMAKKGVPDTPAFVCWRRGSQDRILDAAMSNGHLEIAQMLLDAVSADKTLQWLTATLLKNLLLMFGAFYFFWCCTEIVAIGMPRCRGCLADATFQSKCLPACKLSFGGVMVSGLFFVCVCILLDLTWSVSFVAILLKRLLSCGKELCAFQSRVQCSGN